MTATTTAATPTPKPKRVRKAAGPMTPNKAITDITKVRSKALEAEDTILAQLPEADRKRVIAFLEAE